MRILILDTNVILHDSNCIEQLSNDNVVIPITVIEELDTFKKGHDSINYNARSFLRKLDALNCKELYIEGAKIGTGTGTLRIDSVDSIHENIKKKFSADSNDNKIINVAYINHKYFINSEVILLSNDANMRIKARSLGLVAEEFSTDKTANATGLYSGSRIIDDVSKTILDKITMGMQEVDASELELNEELTPNEFLILRNEKKSVLAIFDASINKIKKLEENGIQGIKPRNADQAFAIHAMLDPKISLVTLSGKAGTGKTIMALAGALQAGKRYNQILISRPVVPLSNKDIGFLPGDIDAKLDPYMQPLYDNLGVIQSNCSGVDPKTFNMRFFMENKKMEVAPLAYIRGRSLVKSFFIIDEAQNLTAHEIKTIITRAGEGTKIILTGDLFQIDHPDIDSQSSGLSYLIEKMQGQKIYAHINLDKGERSELAEIASNIL